MLRRTLGTGFAFLLTGAAIGALSPLYGAEPVAVDVALGDVSINKIPFLIAADAGIYARNGLNVHQALTPGAAAAIARSGLVVPAQYVSADIAEAPIMIGGGSPTLVEAVEKNQEPHVIVSTTEDIVRDDVIALPATASLDALKGKKIGYSGHGAVSNYDSIAFARKMGWEPGKDVTLVSGAANFEALKSGKADAILASNQVVALMPDGFKDLGDLSIYKIPLAGSGVMVRANWLPQNRDTVARFVKATIEATALMKKDRKQFDASVTKWFAITDPKVLDRMFKAGQVIPDKPYPSVAGVKASMAAFDSPAMRGHKPEEFYDSSFIAALDKSGFLDHPM